MLVVGLSLAFLIGVVAIAASAANVQDLLYNRLGKLDVALALPVIGATTLLWSANLTATALFAVSWNWLLQGDQFGSDSACVARCRIPRKIPALASSLPARGRCRAPCSNQFQFTVNSAVGVHSKQCCWC